ncbi:MAG: hypothetical protein KBD43_11265 [Saprospiraceae bacterium]|nr:hypothetical protein [Saprospiraceae bacterium]
MESQENFGSFFYLNSASTLLSYSSGNEESYAHNFHFMLPNFIMLVCYFDSYLSSTFHEINANDLLDLSDLLPKDKNRCIENCRNNNTEKKSQSEMQEFDKRQIIAKKFDGLNLHEKYNYLVKRIFKNSLYLEPYCSVELRKDYFNRKSGDYSRPMYPDTLIFGGLMKAIVKDRNAIAHPKNTFTQKNLSEGIPDLFPNTATFLNIEAPEVDQKILTERIPYLSPLKNIEAHEIAQNYPIEGMPYSLQNPSDFLNIEAHKIGQKNLMVLNAIHKKIANFQSFFEIGIAALFEKNNKEKKKETNS